MAKTIPAQDFCDSVFDGTHDTPKPCKFGHPLLLSKNIQGNRINLQDTYNISDEDFKTINTRSKVSQWDILFSMIGTVGSVYLEKNKDIPYAIKNMGVFSTKDELKAKWLYYYLHTNEAKAIISNFLNGAVQKFLPLSFLREFPVKEMPQDAKQIVSVLENIDAKIENNNVICADLEGMAKLLYDYWFVQFDFPDENGKPYKSNGGKMVWNEELKREIPKGWRAGNLYDIAEFINGLACQKFRPVGDEDFLPVIKIGEMHEGITSKTEFVRTAIPEKNIIHDGDILFSWSATLEAMIWSGGIGGLNQHIFRVDPKVCGKHYIYQQLSAYIVNFVKMAEARKTTMGHITTDHLKQSRIPLPPENLISRYEAMVEDAYALIVNCKQENRDLASLRDFLLPMLMNGQIKVG